MTKLNLLNFRNYLECSLELEPGMTVFQGPNGHGKSNLMETIYMTAIAKSPRSASDRELLGWDVVQNGGHVQIAGIARDHELTVQAQIDFDVIPRVPEPGSGGARPAPSIKKELRVNGVPRPASEFVGAVNVVAFSAEDLELIVGGPAIRRRYLDILISQSDSSYLKMIQRYGRVVTQRNHLLRQMREGRVGLDELEFWDDRLVNEGAAIIERRALAVERLAVEAAPRHLALSGGRERLGVVYRPRISAIAENGLGDIPSTIPDLIAVMREALETGRQREIGQGATVIGPHRDEIVLSLNDEEAGAYSSRGQARTIALALRLAEGVFVTEATGRTPVLALDDVLSELDESRRRLVLENVASYEQVLITTTDFDRVEDSYLSGATRMRVESGQVTRVDG
ncbi:MAG: DNA replication and repair protein RecF [Dehalococcoidia bacterium]|nr:DNA replication and repair protein RecF [Dehalococcoidia bacterium]MDP6273935.1 DNA replication and repair protein RecF [Dehalococcoidia bacterium]MDP7160494.1 DNA replication and repair protein RecF [Dehalococcoidia bacterium]MDP7212103.1 DNA replication and repair protein RecF [Dehalococcoidia bacterium]MDP7515073.1 DNA replication and repair protein RecF [Dehalococcoidia bacterium]